MHARRSTTLHVPEWDRLQVTTCIAGQHRRSQRSTAFTNARCLVRGNGAFAAGRATPRGHIRQRVKDAETCKALHLSLQRCCAQAYRECRDKHIVGSGWTSTHLLRSRCGNGTRLATTRTTSLGFRFEQLARACTSARAWVPGSQCFLEFLCFG